MHNGKPIKRIATILWLFCSCCCLCRAQIFSTLNENFGESMVEHKVNIIHPGINTSEAMVYSLFQNKDNGGKILEYYMDVETVVCGDSQCRIDLIRMYWDSLGFYKRLELPERVELEKDAGKSFDSQDYSKLNGILSDKHSSLKTVYKEEVVGSETTEGIDAVSGATILLNTKDYVQGAVWTSYTLWHWANGNVFDEIRRITGNQYNNTDLSRILEGNDKRKLVFALEQIVHRKVYDAQTIRNVQKTILAQDRETIKLVIRYLENGGPEVYYPSLRELLTGKNEVTRQLLLNSLIKYGKIAPKEFYESVSVQLSIWQDYPSIDLFFKLLKKKNHNSALVTSRIIELLDADNFIISRRAYWFLKTCPLTQKQKERVDSFGSIHGHKL